MNLKGYSVKETSEFKGELRLRVKHNGTQYDLVFDFERHGTPPNAHSPFPSPDKDIYAWPAEEIPEELTFDAGTEEAQKLTLGFSSLPDGINLIHDEYSEVEVGKSPFINYSD